MRALLLFCTLSFLLAPLQAALHPLNVGIAKQQGVTRLSVQKAPSVKKNWDRGNRAMLKNDKRRTTAPLKKITRKSTKTHRKLKTRGGDWRKPIVKRKLQTISPEEATQYGLIEAPITRTVQIKKYRSPKRQHGFSPRRKSTPSMQNINKYVYRESHPTKPGMPVKYLPTAND